MGLDPARRNKRGDRYNTGEIILRLEKDRRRAILMFFGGLVGFLVIVGLFSIFSSHESRVPPAAPPAPPAPVASPSPVPSPAPSGAPAPPPAAPAAPAGVHVKVNLAKAAPAWVDGESQGVKKVLELSLKPGKHEIKVRFGRKVQTEVIAISEETPVVVFFDPRKKHAVVRAIP